MNELPYGIADFHRIRRQGFVYVDRTAHIRDLERLGSILVFLRPRRFGKSLWLQTLANYYDVRRKDEHEDLFGGLAAGGEAATPLANRYFVLQWNFSTVDPGGTVAQIAESLREHVSAQAEVFAREYRDFLAPIKVDGSPAAILRSILLAVSETPYKLYLLIDEYDNFVNEVMVQDAGTYRALFGKDGPYKQLFKSVKSGTEGQGLERVFVTGVSPVALNELRDGFNIAEDVSLAPELASLCGFREAELRGILRSVAEDRGLAPGRIDEALDTMRAWYNGYRFARGTTELIFNPTDVIDFLRQVRLHREPPRQVHGEIGSPDARKLGVVARTKAGTDVIEELTESDDGTVTVAGLEASLSLDDLARRMAKDRGVVASALYYMGLLTQTEDPFRLEIPNLGVKKRLVDLRALGDEPERILGDWPGQGRER